MMNYGYYHYNYLPTFGIFGFIFQIIWWLLVFWLLMAVIRHFSGHKHLHHHHFDDDSTSEPIDSALNILRERYAKGEITKKDFDSMKKDLS
jgi:putative membrane protein